MDKLNLLIIQRIQLQKSLKTLEEEKDMLDVQIKHIMKESGQQEYVDATGNKVVFKSHTREKFNKELCKQTIGEEMFSKFITEEQYYMLKVMSLDDINRLKNFRFDFKK